METILRDGLGGVFIWARHAMPQASDTKSVKKAICRAIAEFAPKATDKSVDRAIVAFPLASLHHVHDLLSRKDATASLEKFCKQIEFCGRQIDFTAVRSVQGTLREAEARALECEIRIGGSWLCLVGAGTCPRVHLGARCRGAPIQRVHPRTELANAERLADIVIGADLKPYDMVDLARPAGQDYHPLVGVPAPLLERYKAVAIRQCETKKIEIHLFRAVLPSEFLDRADGKNVLPSAVSATDRVLRISTSSSRASSVGLISAARKEVSRNYSTQGNGAVKENFTHFCPHRGVQPHGYQ